MARFTAANAREMAAKAHAARQQRLASGKLAGKTFPQTPQVGPKEAANDYVSKRLARVRAQLDLVDSAIEKAIGGDSKRLKELCEAQSRLEEQERRLSGRPLPGSRRPKDNGNQPATPGAYRIHHEPAPAVQSPAPSKADTCLTQPAARMVEDEPVPLVAKDGSLDSLAVEPPTPAPTDTPTPPTRGIVVTTATAATMHTVPKDGPPNSLPVQPLPA